MPLFSSKEKSTGHDASLEDLVRRVNKMVAAAEDGRPVPEAPPAQPPEAEQADEDDMPVAEDDMPVAEDDMPVAEVAALPERPERPDCVFTEAVTPAPSAGEPLLPAYPEETTDEFVPMEPMTLRETGLTDSQVEALIVKLLLARGDMVGRDVADHIRLPFMLVDQVMRRMKLDRLLSYRGSAPMNDYVYELTDIGRERARRQAEHCSYFGSAPVSLSEYVASVAAQSLTAQHPTREDLERAFADLLIPSRMLARLGPAINSGRGLFLYGVSGHSPVTV